MKFISQTLSVVFHPLLLTTYVLLLGFVLPGYMAMLPYGYKKTVFIVFALITGAVPAIFLFLMYNLRIINSLTMEKRQERYLPLLMVAIFYVSAYVIARRFPAELPRFTEDLLLTGAVASLLAFGMNFLFKISLHTLGMAANLVFFLSYFFLFQLDILYYLIIAVSLTGLIAALRLYLNAHRPYEVWLGIVFGALAGAVPHILTLL